MKLPKGIEVAKSYLEEYHILNVQYCFDCDYRIWRLKCNCGFEYVDSLHESECDDEMASFVFLPKYKKCSLYSKEDIAVKDIIE